MNDLKEMVVGFLCFSLFILVNIGLLLWGTSLSSQPDNLTVAFGIFILWALGFVDSLFFFKFLGVKNVERS